MKIIALLSILLVASVGLFAQDQAPPSLPPSQMLSPDQLNGLVAPIALYPDPLLSQVLVAATYPLELVQALQWLQKTPGLSGSDLTAAAAQQNWDPSIQALVVFPDVLKRLNEDITWTTNLGNAFLAQQQDVMDAVQRMRQEAQQAGKLASTPQENVVTDNDGGQPYISIVPANPDVIYVPVYDPVWIWGPPVWYPYARWYYPPRSVIYSGVGFGFGGGINVGFYFGPSWRGWGGWGWRPGWGNRTVIVNNTFIRQNNFNTTRIANGRGSEVWSHDPGHRVGVPYSNPALNNRYQGNVQQNYARPYTPAPARNSAEPSRSLPVQGGAERFGNRPMPNNVAPAQNRPVFRGTENARPAQGAFRSAPVRSEPARSSPAPRSESAPRSAPQRGGRHD